MNYASARRPRGPAHWRSASFFSRLLQRTASRADRHQARFLTPFLLQLDFQFPQINIGTGSDLRDQPICPGMPLRLTRGGCLWRDLTCLAALLLDQPHPRLRDLETRRDIARAFVRITSGKHLAAKLRCVRIHYEHLLLEMPQPTEPAQNAPDLPRKRTNALDEASRQAYGALNQASRR